MKKKHSFFYKNSLSIVFSILFIITLLAQALTGWKEHSEEMLEKGGIEVGFGEYLTTGHFVQATFENWESEFLQMALYVLFTVFLRQKGSSESKKLDEKEEVDRKPQPHKDAPWPVKKGGLWLAFYKNSLSIVFFTLFLISFVLHLQGSMHAFNDEQVLQGKQPLVISQYLHEPRFWFESFQNWQSEFLSIVSIVILSIFLRQQGSPESKPVDAPDSETGE